MAEVTIEVDDKGNIGTLPEPVQKFLDARINEAVKRTAERKEAEFKDKIVDPAEKERLKLLEQENAKFKEDKALAEKNYDEARRLQEERLAREVSDRDERLKSKDTEITRRDERLRSMLGSEIKAAATAAGARAESLPELVKLLGAELDLDPQTLEPFVKGKDGKPATDKDGKPVSIEGFVTQYLTDHPHHLGRKTGKPGGAPGGATFRQASRSSSAKDEAFAALDETVSTRTITGAVRAMRTQTTA
jgi:hypothetical protein